MSDTVHNVTTLPKPNRFGRKALVTAAIVLVTAAVSAKVARSEKFASPEDETPDTAA